MAQAHELTQWAKAKLRGLSRRAASQDIRSHYFDPTSLSAAKRTIDLAFRVGCKCSLVCFMDGHIESIRKLDPGPVSDPIIKRQLNSFGIAPNKHRILQCIVKSYTPPRNPIPEEYDELLRKAAPGVMDGIYVFVMSDMPLLRKDGTHPWPMVLPPDQKGMLITPKPSMNARYLPIFNTFSMEGCLDIALPNYDDLEAPNASKAFATPPWNERKSVAIFRGSSTGCGTSAKTNPRLALANLSLPSDILNAGITVYGKSPRFDPERGLSRIQPGQTKSFKPMEEIAQYKYVVHVDGNVAAYRLANMMRIGCLQLIIDGPYSLWYSSGVVHGQNSIKIKSTSDLESWVQWCQSNDSEAKAMAHRGATFSKSLLGIHIAFTHVALVASCLMPQYDPKKVLDSVLPKEKD